METPQSGNVEFGIIVKNTLKTFKMFMTIFTMSFFLGMLFRTVITFQMVSLEEEERQTCGSAYGYFFACYNLNSQDKSRDVLIFIYYSFTTLSTIGFGDYHPKSNIERIFIAMVMFFGVMIFSSIMGNFIEMLN